MDTFAKEPKLAKLLRELKSAPHIIQPKNFTAFSRMFVMVIVLFQVSFVSQWSFLFACAVANRAI